MEVVAPEGRVAKQLAERGDAAFRARRSALTMGQVLASRSFRESGGWIELVLN
jgi:hypothetical protein